MNLETKLDWLRGYAGARFGMFQRKKKQNQQKVIDFLRKTNGLSAQEVHRRVDALMKNIAGVKQPRAPAAPEAPLRNRAAKAALDTAVDKLRTAADMNALSNALRTADRVTREHGKALNTSQMNALVNRAERKLAAMLNAATPANTKAPATRRSRYAPSRPEPPLTRLAASKSKTKAPLTRLAASKSKTKAPLTRLAASRSKTRKTR
jgi:polyhydroxyalkanoate synthesis regulator phasin